MRTKKKRSILRNTELPISKVSITTLLIVSLPTLSTRLTPTQTLSSLTFVSFTQPTNLRTRDRFIASLLSRLYVVVTG